ncbi:serine/threonine-protein kinase 3/4-like [Paramacrobiotus metropolitanus]|uniref:serine/threonine-protein kinase 3/4-like n=1 Tax=Paramacrobiotus metropolitanus TaxID=2943436 RepID=UPI0024463B50|nr:serine/threonine-protein kinase 3/4-like [Paramacrobiotus metropolitanus]
MAAAIRAHVDGEICHHLILQLHLTDYRPPFEYTMGRVLGRGALSRGVYLATAKISRRQFAVKRIQLTSSSVNELLRESVQEFKAVVANNAHPHTNVVRYYYMDIAYFDNAPEVCIFMEYCEGGTLEHKNDELNAAGKRYKQADIVRDLTGILKGIEYLHKNGKAHRDLKPANILFDADGTPKIADFGLMIQLQNSVTRKNELPRGEGTLLYAAPEVFNQAFGNLGRACDIWALGCILLEMLQGHDLYYKRKDGSGKLVNLATTSEIIAALSNGTKPYYTKDFGRQGCGDTRQFLDAAANFLEQCFHSHPSNRSSAHMLLNHPLIQGKSPTSSSNSSDSGISSELENRLKLNVDNHVLYHVHPKPHSPAELHARHADPSPLFHRHHSRLDTSDEAPFVTPAAFMLFPSSFPVTSPPVLHAAHSPTSFPKSLFTGPPVGSAMPHNVPVEMLFGDVPIGRHGCCRKVPRSPFNS